MILQALNIIIIIMNIMWSLITPGEYWHDMCHTTIVTAISYSNHWTVHCTLLHNVLLQNMKSLSYSIIQKHSWKNFCQNNIHKCQNTLKLAGKHSRFTKTVNILAFKCFAPYSIWLDVTHLPHRIIDTSKYHNYNLLKYCLLRTNTAASTQLPQLLNG